MTAQEFLSDLQKIEGLVAAGLKTAEALNPSAAAPIEAVSLVFPIVSELVTVALTAWSNANNTPITIEAIQALLPNQTPLTPPDAA